MPKTPTAPTTDSPSITEALTELEAIVRWFDQQDAVDVEAGLTKVRHGAVLIRDLKARLKEAENEFVAIKQSLQDDGS